MLLVCTFVAIDLSTGMRRAAMVVAVAVLTIAVIQVFDVLQNSKFAKVILMPEVTGQAAILISPNDPDAWVHNMLELASDAKRRTELAAAVRQQALRFKLEHSATSLLKIYEQAVSLPKRGATETASPSGNPLVPSSRQ
jgi:glycosyltransferase involved in cell wall biosynthesis